MKPSLIGAGVAAVSTCLFCASEQLAWFWLTTTPGVSQVHKFWEEVLFFPAEWIFTHLNVFGNISQLAGVIISIVINTLIGLPLGWLAGKIYRIWKSRPRS